MTARHMAVIAAVALAAGAAAADARLTAATVKVQDPTSVVMIVNRDSNEIAFMDIKTKKIVGKTFLGNNVNPHMVMMSPDGRYVVTGGTRANKAYIIDARTLELVKVIPVDIAPEHLAFSPDGRWYYQGNPEGDSISVIDMVSLTKIKTIPGLVGQFTERMIEGYYNFELSEKLRLSLHLQHQFERTPGEPDRGFLVPAIRVQARF